MSPNTGDVVVAASAPIGMAVRNSIVQLGQVGRRRRLRDQRGDLSGLVSGSPDPRIRRIRRVRG